MFKLQFFKRFSFLFLHLKRQGAIEGLHRGQHKYQRRERTYFAKRRYTRPVRKARTKKTRAMLYISAVFFCRKVYLVCLSVTIWHGIKASKFFHQLIVPTF